MRKQYTVAFKAQVVLELLKGEKIATGNLSSVFGDGEKKSSTVLKKQHEKETEELYSKIGKHSNHLLRDQRFVSRFVWL